MKKYKMIKEDSKVIGEHILYRIQALKTFKNAKEGEFGGYIESTGNLSHDDDCWIYPGACAYGNGIVRGNATIAGDVSVHECGIVESESYLYALGGASMVIRGHATVTGCSILNGNIVVTDDVIITGASKIISKGDKPLVIGGKMCIGKESLVTDYDQDDVDNEDVDDEIIDGIDCK